MELLEKRQQDNKVVDLGEYREKHCSLLSEEDKEKALFYHGYVPHCWDCMAPVKPVLETYKGDSCRLHTEFQAIYEDLEDFTLEQLKAECITKLPKLFPDIPDIEKTVDELIFCDFEDLGLLVPCDDGSYTTNQAKQSILLKKYLADHRPVVDK